MNKCDQFRASPKGRLIIVCALIIGLAIALWGLVLFMGAHHLAYGTIVPNWVMSITRVTQSFFLSGLMLYDLASLLVTVGIIIFLVMCLLLPRSRNICPK